MLLSTTTLPSIFKSTFHLPTYHPSFKLPTFHSIFHLSFQSTFHLPSYHPSFKLPTFHSIFHLPSYLPSIPLDEPGPTLLWVADPEQVVPCDLTKTFPHSCRPLITQNPLPILPFLLYYLDRL